MTLLKLDISSVRNIQHASIIPSPGINLIVGDNGSGKSALIEAIHILGRARSFRSASAKSVIQFDRDHLLVTAQSTTPYGTQQHLGIQVDHKSFTCRINSETMPTRAALAYALPLQLIYPKSYELLDAGPQFRREFLDWGVFNVDKSFLSAWRHFNKALLQRNSLLKSKRTDQLYVWNKELINYGTIVQQCRRRYLQKLKPEIIKTLSHLLAIGDVELKLVSGCEDPTEFEDALRRDLDKDLRDGFTHSGPHRSDLQVTVNCRLAKDVVSRGQLKLLVIGLKLAQVQILSDEFGDSGCILIDDFAAELDPNNRAKVLKFLSDRNCQVFVTATDVGEFGDRSQLHNYKMFHVEHGNIKPV